MITVHSNLLSMCTLALTQQDFFMLRLPLVFAILFMAVSAKAASAHEDSARQFVDLLRYEDQYSKYHDACIQTHRAVSPHTLVAQNPNYFRGIRPGDKQWPAIVAAYEEYFLEACSRPTKSEFLEVLSASYAKMLSSQQLQDAIAFYSSGTGQALVSANTFATAEVYRVWPEINGKHLAKVTARFQAKIDRLAQSK